MLGTVISRVSASRTAASFASSSASRSGSPTITAAVAAIRRTAPGIPLEVKCDTLDQVREALSAGVHLVLLDNFGLDDTVAAVELTRGTGCRLEASGGLTLERARAVAQTHSAPVLDLGFGVRD
jgi:nicotinate-nucleotide pyrophosphorylase (carboxylating)